MPASTAPVIEIKSRTAVAAVTAARVVHESSSEGDHKYTVNRFSGRRAAKRYSRSLVGTPTHRREIRCLTDLLDGVAAGSHVLDLPCGTGRLLPFLREAGFRVTAVDSSAEMIESAKGYAQHRFLDREAIRFVRADALATGFDDEAFDAVVCNRLFHHFPKPETRIRGLRELRRISSGPVVVSFFSLMSWDGVTFAARNRLRGTKAYDRIPIPPAVFRAEAREAGFASVEFRPSRNVISRQWYTRLT